MNRFAFNPTDVSISRSTFSLSHSVKFSFNVGELIPFYVNSDVLPGDTFQIQTSKVVRLQPLVSPIMDNLYLDVYYFFVPHRLVYDHFREFMGENNTSYWTQPTEYNIPHLKLNSGSGNDSEVKPKTILDYMGIPTSVKAGNKFTFSALPIRAYCLCWNEWFRSENISQPVHIYTDDTDRTIASYSSSPTFANRVTNSELGNYPPLQVCKYFDYFTSCLPSPQKGPSVTFELAGSAPVTTGAAHIMYGDEVNNGMILGGINSSNKLAKAVTTSGKERVLGVGYDSSSTSPSSTMRMASSEQSALNLSQVVPVNLWANLSEVSQFSINELRTAFAIQKFYEKQARGGTRYIEMIKSFFNVDSSDSRMQRPEYLGGSRLPLNVSQVEQTSATESGLTPLGDVAGMSVTGDVHGDFIKSFEEHGTLIGLCAVRYNHTYQQGLNRMWSRRTLFDFYFPTFANVGERSTLNKEIYVSTSATDNEAVFGYNEAWSEYRYTPSRCAGEMRSNYATSLDYWHLGDEYNSRPTLSSDWIFEDKAPLDRCLAVTSAVSNQLIADFYLDIKATRPMPAYSIPGLIDHH